MISIRAAPSILDYVKKYEYNFQKENPKKNIFPTIKRIYFSPGILFRPEKADLF